MKSQGRPILLHHKRISIYPSSLQLEKRNKECKLLRCKHQFTISVFAIIITVLYGYIVRLSKNIVHVTCTSVYNCNMIIHRGIHVKRLPGMRSDVGSNGFPLSLCHLLKKRYNYTNCLLPVCNYLQYHHSSQFNFFHYSWYSVVYCFFPNCAVKDIGKDSLICQLSLVWQY